MKILGIDPGTATCGWAVIDDEPNRLADRDYDDLGGGIIRTGYGNMASKLSILRRDLETIYMEYRPVHIAVEGGYVGPQNAQTALAIGYARGIALLLSGDHDIPLDLYPPAKVKKAVTQSGKAEKDAVQIAVHAILGVTTRTYDESDAYAVAICHSKTRRNVPI